MATHSSTEHIPCAQHMDRGASRATVHKVAKIWTSAHTYNSTPKWKCVWFQNHVSLTICFYCHKAALLQGGNKSEGMEIQFRSGQSLSRAWLFATPWTTAHQTSLSTINSQSLLKLMPIESVTPPSHHILCRPLLLLPQSLPDSGSFPMSQLFAWGHQSIRVSASASVLPINTQDSSPLGWTGWISLQSKGLSRLFSNITVQKHQFFSAQLSSQSNSHIHTWPLEKP